MEEEVGNTPEKKVPLSLKVRLIPEENASVELKHNNVSYLYQSQILVRKASTHPLNEEIIRRQLRKLNDTAYVPDRIDIETENAFLAVSEINQLRREAIQAFDEYRLEKNTREITKGKVYFPDIVQEKQTSETLLEKDGILSIETDRYHLDPIVNPSSIYEKHDFCAVSEFGGILRDCKDKIAYYTLNCSNSYSYEFLHRLGFSHIVLSSELNETEIRDLKKAYEERNHTKIRPFVLKEGNRVLMYIASDPFGKYLTDRNKEYVLSDGSREYTIRFRNGISEILEKERSSGNTDASCNELIVID